MRSTNEAGGFWGVLARKAKSILDDRQSPTSSLKPIVTTFSTSNHHGIQYEAYSKKIDDSPTSGNGMHTSLTSFSLNQIGDTIGNALEEAAKKSEDRIQETSAAGNSKRSALNDEEKDYAEPIQESTQLKASRHVAIATADKAKQLARELKSVKADLAVAKERCCQLEEENKILREKGPTDDDMIRDQLETLLAEKGVLAHENSVYARENRYLREIVEFHHLSMQDHMLMYLDQDDDNLLSSFHQIHPVVSD
ncbi:hypothetical protein Ccrd_018457 [Cynara cardunculus var. scolymus]|uniref:Uncharacterized protein n=2 Tax=Cynara cardunculus var. scolymus TaxID=59895 RepID=A0A103Y669_CYNCS|nr:hypothetical protein Ccrd_018457 [Cynara cardunculus var. scolymus]